MKIVNIHDAKTNLSKLLEDAERGESFIIARAGKPIAKVLKLDAQAKPKRIGFIKDRGRIPDDFDTMLRDEIADAFEGKVGGELDVRGPHVLTVRLLPNIHRDPFDRILVAQAHSEGLSFLTADATLQAYGSPVILV